jgi:esterase/lipase superfamily enzyme
MTTVYFATNRRNDGAGPRDFGSNIVAHDEKQITYAVVDVSNIQLPDENSGVIGPVNNINMGNFNDATLTAITNAGHNLLIFIHGASNKFDNAIKRAAFNCEWFAAAGGAATRTTVIAFTWPSAEVGSDIIGGYRSDQARAGQSGFHILSFLHNIIALRNQFIAAHPQGRVFLLAHSMGNHALQSGIQNWFESHGTNALIFDQVILAAPDETAGTFERPNGGGLSTLTQLSDRISIYYSQNDRLMWASSTANNNQRLGWNGPASKMDTDLYPEDKFRIVDCTLALDYSLIVPWDASHQYYRRSRAVRSDIVACLVDNPRPPGGMSEISTAPMV